MTSRAALYVAITATITLAIAGAAQAQGRSYVKALHDAVLRAPVDETTLRAYMDTLPKDGTYYVVEGDILLSEQQLRVYLAAKAAAPQPPGPELTVNVVNGERDFWKDPNTRTLSYAVSRASFPTPDTYQEVVSNMKAAAAEWSQVCTECTVRFVHLDQFDANPSHNDVVFIVRHYDSGRSYVAAAFFPSDGSSRRYLNVDPSYFTTTYDRVGVFRHELGHVLGYRHEHIRDVRGCYHDENNQWQPLTAYDPRSVMHYFCGGGGTMRLTLTEIDRTGHRTLYGR